MATPSSSSVPAATTSCPPTMPCVPCSPTCSASTPSNASRSTLSPTSRSTPLYPASRCRNPLCSASASVLPATPSSPKSSPAPSPLQPQTTEHLMEKPDPMEKP